MHPNGVDPDAFAPGRFDSSELNSQRQRLELEPEDVVAGFVGTFGHWHGAEVFADAVALLAKRDPALFDSERLRVLFVGDGLHLPDVRTILRGSAVEPYVRYPGLVPQAEAPGYLAVCDVLVSPHIPNPDGTRFFGSPTKLFEYMASGKAIIASDLDQIGEVLRPSLQADALSATPNVPPPDTPELAILTQPADADAIARSLSFLVRNREWRERLGASARREASAHYTWDQHVSAILAGIEHACLVD
jgi:glycosyltransferase involved in cell wall biosynthesis